MKLFAGALLFTFVGSILLRKASLKLHVALLCVMCVFVGIGYFFFNRI